MTVKPVIFWKCSTFLVTTVYPLVRRPSALLVVLLFLVRRKWRFDEGVGVVAGDSSGYGN